jgi:beta-phosphoglucomutase
MCITTDSIFFFDMDGTLIDTNFSNFSAYKKAIESVIDIDCNLIYNPKKRFNRGELKTNFPHLTDSEIEKIVRLKEAFYNEFLSLNELIIENIEVLNKYFRNYETYLVTNCRKERAMSTLNYFSLTDKFTNIFYRVLNDQNIKVNKFQNAISLLGVDPKRVIVFENEESEIEDARKAGILIINPNNI